MDGPIEGQVVHRVVLPSGKTIEVAYFRDESLLHVCQECSRDLVYPTAWEEVAPDRWQLTLRCPNCESRRDGIFDREQVERLDEALEWGAYLVMVELRQLSYANRVAEVGRFVDALAGDNILPIDF